MRHILDIVGHVDYSKNRTGNDACPLVFSSCLADFLSNLYPVDLLSHGVTLGKFGQMYGLFVLNIYVCNIDIELKQLIYVWQVATRIEHTQVVTGWCRNNV